MNIPDASQYLSPEEQKTLLTRDNFKGLIEVIDSWLWIAFAFTLIYVFPNPFGIIVGLFILAGKQLAVSVLMHDASHKSLFKNSTLNDFFGKWFGAYPIFGDMLRYRPYHVSHHVHTGLDTDPDIGLTTGYPAGKMSMIRKFARDLTGLTGIKSNAALMMMHLDYLEYTQNNDPKRIDQSNRTWAEFFRTAYRNLSGPILANVILFLLLSFIDPWLYMYWIIAYLTTFQFCIRVRAMAEHSMVEDKKNPIVNTRTTYANWIEQMLFAPHNVNYHLEHHMLMGVPCYNLPAMHKLLKFRGFYKHGTLAKGYWQILKKASTPRTLVSS